ncbi:hypothetical protein A1O7_07625 [Cladophialophora yegresii CBS 114405]|uniref:HRQ family protein 2 n=1 Tax=Cladophialophora yegresii CBS 114405 TaxID=1182544 RepID=W9VP01_9EURO|nr:uncharacterized protein A1O7_07625 [Cladophialophora yegresii CBS 114405]EXJ57278.1 hypothetical protein A1O7_07625 [Cladophialophora yegresii CBS 114405]
MSRFDSLEKPSFTWHWRSLDDFKKTSWFTLGNYSNVILLIVFLLLAFNQIRRKQNEAKKAGFEKRYLKAPEFPEVEELPDFDWRTTEPLQLRPFKPKYHLTMALENLSPSELLLMDKNYADRIAYRRKIMAEEGEHVVAVNEDYRVRPAVVELYQYLMGTYLPLRFPSMFKLHEAFYEAGQTFMLENLVTKALFPAKASPSTPTAMLLETLGRTIDEDFLFLLPEEDEDPSPDNKDKDYVPDAKYILEAYVCCCPSGFDPREKLGKRLASIHEPVPGYPAKIEASMDRFFSRLEVGKYVRRANWSITTNKNLYSAGKGTNHAHEGDDVSELEEIDTENTFLRCERQTLHRLPKTKALVFAFKTYMYPIKDVKDEGKGRELAEAIDGLKEGSVPQMHFYKRGVVWGEAVKRYLRS